MNLLSLLACLTKRDPHAIIAIDVDPDRPQHVSRAELWRRTLQLRADLATAGVGRGCAVLACLPGWSYHLDWQIATASLGAHVVAVDPVGTTPGAPGGAPTADTLAHLLERTRPTVAVAPHHARTGSQGSADVSALLRDASSRADAPTPTVAVVTGPHDVAPVDPSPYDLGAGAWLPSAATAGMPMPEIAGDEAAVLLGPSLAVHHESALARHAGVTAEALDLRADDVVLCTRPPSEAVGLGTTLAAALGGATCLLDPAPTASGILSDLTRFGVTHLVTDDITIAALARAREAAAEHATIPTRGVEHSGPPLRAVGLVDTGGDTGMAAQQAARTFGIRPTVLWGTADALFPLTSATTDAAIDAATDADDPADTDTDRGTAPPARPVSPDIAVRVVDSTSGEPVEPGVRGEIQVRGYPVPHTHLGAPEQASPHRTGDWWPTGRTGTLTPNGALHHTPTHPATP